MPWRRLVAVLAVVSASSGLLYVEAGVPSASLEPQAVAREVDAAIAAALFKPDTKLAPRCDDATFLRRVWLDVVGDIPAPEHTIAFLLDRSADKRERVIRTLLADPQYGVNWARYWRDVIMYRRAEDRALIAANALEADLSEKLNQNESWDSIAAAFVTATGDVRDNGDTALLMAQEARTEETTAEVARIFLGIQIQCAQCHDHKTDSWTREQFHELAAFFPRIGVRPVQSPTRRSFMVFASDRQARRRPNDNQDRPVAEHYMPDLEDPSAPGTLMTPKFFLSGAELPLDTYDADRRATLAQWLVENEWFATAFVNRIWAELVGEGFYEPVDDIGPEREASAPEAIRILASAFRASGFDVKWLVETICATEAYQRESRPRRGSGEGVAFAANVPQPLRADVLYNSVLSALDLTDGPPGPAGRPGAYRAAARSPRVGFNGTFGYDPSEPRDTISGSIPQVLATMNSPRMAGMLRRRNGVVDRLTREIRSDEELVAELYLRALAREPSRKESARCLAYVEQASTRREAFEDITWVLLNSAEFRYRR